MQDLQYAILWHHDIDQPHYDLMFETSPGASLATWRSLVWPIEEPTEVIRLRDHRPAFLTFQGELTGSRGNVVQVAQGTCAVQKSGTSDAIWTIRLHSGSPISGLRIRQIDGERWQAELL